MATFANINVGTAPNDGTGSSLREAFRITNNNFVILSNVFQDTTNLNVNVTSTGTSTFEQIDANIINVQTLGNAGTLITGNIVTPLQPNITALGNLGSLVVVGTTSLQETTIDGNLTTNSNLFAASTLYAQADVEFQGQQRVNVNLVSGTYSVSDTDYIIAANLMGNTNCTVILPNADISSGRSLIVYYYDPEGTNANTTVLTVEIQANAGNIIQNPRSGGTVGTTLRSNNSVTSSIHLVSDGNYWLQL